MQDRRRLLCAQESSRPRPRDDDQDMQKQVRRRTSPSPRFERDEPVDAPIHTVISRYYHADDHRQAR
jgi:hypothetical protein